MIKSKEQIPNDVRQTAGIDLADAIEYLADVKGKVELAFKPSESAHIENMCLAFVRIPLEGEEIANIVEVLVTPDKNARLSAGRLEVEVPLTGNRYTLVGAIRIKRIDMLGTVLHSLVFRMKDICKMSADIQSRQT